MRGVAHRCSFSHVDDDLVAVLSFQLPSVAIDASVLSSHRGLFACCLVGPEGLDQRHAEEDEVGVHADCGLGALGVMFEEPVFPNA